MSAKTPGGGVRRRKAATPPTCRVCGTLLGSAAERKLGRCLDCPSTYDEKVYESLREWRLTTAREAEVPAFVIFTDATLMAIAEAMPDTPTALSKVSGVGAAKLERYGKDVLDILGAGSTPA